MATRKGSFAQREAETSHNAVSEAFADGAVRRVGDYHVQVNFSAPRRVLVYAKKSRIRSGTRFRDHSTGPAEYTDMEFDDKQNN